ncbi:hypothetical protein AaE_006881 [Aphanomyces astaci]|uniref:Uncharacterized protein n=1 Tax=Aphanomyces astaci TaxID=112090 RepID=A0A6A5AIX6_APHAT|nr:hypothetical protein AaE_006881 [Aphanomyces astaci]
MSGAVPAVPLPADYFPRISLPSTVVAAFEDAARVQVTADLNRLQAETTSSHVGTASSSFSRRQPFRTDEQGYSVLERDGASIRVRMQSPQTPRGTGSPTISFACHVDVVGLPSELLDVMYADNTLALREWGRTFLSNWFVDAAVLHCIHRHGGGDGPRTFAAVTWLALHLPSSIQTDLCLFQSMGTCDNLPYITWTSVEVQICPSQEHLKFRRSRLHMTMFLQATTTGTRLTCFGSMEQLHLTTSQIMCKKCTVVRPVPNQLDGLERSAKVCLRCVAMPRSVSSRPRPSRPPPSVGRQPHMHRSSLHETNPLPFDHEAGGSRGRSSLPLDIRPRLSVRASRMSAKAPTTDPMQLLSSSSSTLHHQRFFGSAKAMSLPSTTRFDNVDPMAAQLWQISCRAQATWTLAKDTTSRNTTPVSTPRDSLAEQAYLLDAIDRASRGRFSATSSPLSNPAMDSLRMSAWGDELGRFEAIPDDLDR